MPPVRHFFHAIYQTQPAIYRGTDETCRTQETKRGRCPLPQAFDMNWDDVATLLHRCRREHTTTGTSPPLLFQNGTAITDPDTLYASNPHAAYLDGCSIIINHADLHHPIIAQLCNDLQQTFRKMDTPCSFLASLSSPSYLTLVCFRFGSTAHVYANAYLTPASSHAGAAHADDRDVLVMQIMGRKKWKVYR